MASLRSKVLEKTQNKAQEKLLKSLIFQAKAYLKDLDEAKIREAYEFAAYIHQHQMRDSGEPYITHPLNVALVLTEYYADEDMIVAALLHDTLEDSEEVTYFTLSKKFGVTVAKLVEGLTKIAEIMPEEQIDSDLTEKVHIQIETIRKIFTNAKQDLRVLLIKLADRYHNMTTIGTKADPMKRVNKANENYQIFVQLAARLGIWKMKVSMEKLCFPFVYPESTEKIAQYQKKYGTKIEKIHKQVCQKIHEADTESIVTGCVLHDRSQQTLHNILKTKGELTENDLLIINIFAKSESDCFLILHILHKLWKTRVDETDYISNPRDNGYKAYHVHIITSEGYNVGFRIQTEEMSKRNWYGVTYDFLQKHEGGKVNFLLPFDSISQNTLGNPKDFFSAAQTDLLSEKIEIHYNNKSVHVPSGSTALDFAFFAYPKQALATKTIRVNQYEVNFEKELRNGDLVSVEFAVEPTVSFDWFYSVNTATARIAIQDSLRSWEHEKKVEIGKEILQKEFDIYGKGRVHNAISRHKNTLFETHGIKSADELYTLVAEGVVQPFEILNSCYPEPRRAALNHWKKVLRIILNKLLWKSEKHVIRLRVIGLLDSNYKVLGRLTEIREKANAILTTSYLREDETTQTFLLKMTFKVDEYKKFHIFISELERIKGVITVSPMLTVRTITIYSIWTLGYFAILLDLPFYIATLPNTPNILLATYLALLPVVVVNYLLFSFLDHYSTHLNASRWVPISGIFLNLLSVGVFTYLFSILPEVPHLIYPLLANILLLALLIHKLIRTHSIFQNTLSRPSEE